MILIIYFVSIAGNLRYDNEKKMRNLKSCLVALKIKLNVNLILNTLSTLLTSYVSIAKK